MSGQAVSRKSGVPLVQAASWGGGGATAPFCLSLSPSGFRLGFHLPLGATLAGLLDSLGHGTQGVLI